MRLFRGLAVALLLLVPSVLRAADTPISPEAKKHVDLGVQQYDAGRFADAVTEFELAYRLSRKPALLFNIARAEGKLGHDEAAIAFLRRYLEERPDAPDASAVLAEIDARQRALEASKAKVAAEADAQAARKEADALAAQAKEAAAKQAAEQQAKPPEPVVVAPPPPPPSMSDASRKKLRHAGAALLAVGPVMAIVGIGLGVSAMQAGDDVTNMMANQPWSTCCAPLESRGNTAQAAGIALDVIGGAVTVTGAILLGVSYRGGADKSAWIAPSGNGVKVGGSF